MDSTSVAQLLIKLDGISDDNWFDGNVVDEDISHTKSVRSAFEIDMAAVDILLFLKTKRLITF